MQDHNIISCGHLARKFCNYSQCQTCNLRWVRNSSVSNQSTSASTTSTVYQCADVAHIHSFTMLCARLVRTSIPNEKMNHPGNVASHLDRTWLDSDSDCVQFRDGCCRRLEIKTDTATSKTNASPEAMGGLDSCHRVGSVGPPGGAMDRRRYN